MISRIGPVTAVDDTGLIGNVNAYRSPLIPTINSNALSVQATSLTLPATIGTTLAHGQFLNPATARQPVAVLGAAAATRLGIDRIWPGERILLVGQSGVGRWFYLAGVLDPAVLAPEIDTAVLVGFPAAQRYLGFDGHPSQIYLRAATDQVTAVHHVLAATANPENPNEVTVSQPSDALVAQAEAKGASEQPVPRPRRHLPARRSHRRRQHHAHLRARTPLRDRTTPSTRRHQRKYPRPIPHRSHPARRSPAALAGVGLGALSTAIYTHTKHWTTVIPVVAWAGGLAAALLIGAVAGLLPAIRAARMSPTQALWSM